MEKFNDDTINYIAKSLSKTLLWRQCTTIINNLYNKQEQSFAEIQKNTKLSPAICRDAVHLLQGACFIECEIQGKKRVCKLTANGHRLFELYQILKNQNKKGA